MLMEEAKIWEHVEKEIIKPTDLTKLVTNVKNKAKAKRIITDLMKEHFIPQIAENTGKEIFEALVVRVLP